jgi:hypothetical protein
MGFSNTIMGDTAVFFDFWALAAVRLARVAAL